MNVRQMTAEEIRRVGLEVLARELGPTGMIRFLQQFEHGHGDYSAERDRWLGDETVDELAREITERRKKTSPN